MIYTDETMLVRSKDKGGAGIINAVSAEHAGWDYLNMVARRMSARQTTSGNTGDYEYAHVILGGRCHIHTSKGDFTNIGKRENVWDGLPHALYLPRNTEFEIDALTDELEIASCWVATDRDYEPKLVTPGADTPIELRGGGSCSRQITSIMPPGFPCHRLVVVEVYTPPGNWSSFPPHKHDVHRVDAQGNIIEADLEEIYFYKINPPEGYAYQRVYNDSRTIDGTMMVSNHDLVLVPEGYHLVVGLPGYQTYYLNFLAGSAQSLANADDPAFAWVKGVWGDLDPRVPVVKA